jgi:exodeoxyribonuclease-5
MDITQFSQDKQDLMPVLSHMFADSSRKILRIQGPAGTGKTTVVEMIVRHYLKFNEIQQMVDPDTKQLTSSNIFLSATTNKALAVIDELAAKKLEPDFGEITVNTIYSLLTLKVFNDHSTGETKVSRNMKQSTKHFAENSLIIIDEAGYADNILWGHIKEQLLSRNLNIILIADFYQATPVGCSISPIFDPSIPEYKLTERFRYPNGSAIHLNSLAFEKAIDTGNSTPLVFDNTFERISRGDLGDIVRSHIINGNLNTKILSYTNNVVVNYNEQICLAKYGDTFFHPTQTVVSNRYYLFGDVAIRNEARLDITEIGDEYEFLGIKVRNVVFRQFKRRSFPVPCNFNDYYRVTNQAKAARDWHMFYRIQETIMDIRHAWASTVHKSQGSTYDNVIIDFDDLMGVKNPLLFYRLLNVATTRPRHKVFLIKD